MKQVLTKSEASEFLQVDPKTIGYLVHTGQIPYIRISPRIIRFDKSELLEWMKDRSGIPYRMNRGNAIDRD